MVVVMEFAAFLSQKTRANAGRGVYFMPGRLVQREPFF